MRRITLDIETANDFVDGGFDPLRLDLSIVCIHDSASDTFASFSTEELPSLWPILEGADLLIGFNSDHFDIPILGKYYSGNLALIPSLDLLKEVKQALGRRIKLDNLAEATLGRKKTGDGLQAVRWWKEGKHDLVRQYCIEDVRITKDLYEFAKKNKKLLYRDWDGVREITLNTARWEKPERSALTHTLPF